MTVTSPLLLPTTGDAAGRKISAELSLMATAMRSFWILSILASSADWASISSFGIVEQDVLDDRFELLALGRRKGARPAGAAEVMVSGVGCGIDRCLCPDGQRGAHEHDGGGRRRASLRR